MMFPEIKICGITNLEDAEYAASQGAKLLGVVLSDLSPRKGSPETVKELSLNGFTVAGVYTDINSVERESTLEDYIQLHFPHGKEDIEFVKEKLHKKVISVVFPGKNKDFLTEALEKLNAGSDLVLIEFGKEITSSDLEQIPDISGKKIGFAGKISVKNLPLILKKKPYFIDLSSKLEEYPGKKDHEKIKSFMEVFRLETTTV